MEHPIYYLLLNVDFFLSIYSFSFRNLVDEAKCSFTTDIMIAFLSYSQQQQQQQTIQKSYFWDYHHMICISFWFARLIDS